MVSHIWNLALVAGMVAIWKHRNKATYEHKLPDLNQCLPKQETSTASSNDHTPKTGDRVKYMGNIHPCGFPPLQPTSRAGLPHGHKANVILALKKHGSSKFGVRFDKALPEEIEKSMLGRKEAYTSLKAKLENLPEDVVAILSSTQIDRKD
ncbi:hypothetical protein IFM89_015802 [Coptis chinensis]|uniref:Uncharacterized protein n=1 Tax=Coptis chinensis TaxID=261450 RepID=A0A835M6F4_9MAGN|nr:hypothetical protein IFM89_015802 [Coptis chinensis]